MQYGRMSISDEYDIYYSTTVDYSLYRLVFGLRFAHMPNSYQLHCMILL